MFHPSLPSQARKQKLISQTSSCPLPGLSKEPALEQFYAVLEEHWTQEDAIDLADDEDTPNEMLDADGGPAPIAPEPSQQAEASNTSAAAPTLFDPYIEASASISEDVQAQPLLGAPASREEPQPQMAVVAGTFAQDAELSPTEPAGSSEHLGSPLMGLRREEACPENEEPLLVRTPPPKSAAAQISAMTDALRDLSLVCADTPQVQKAAVEAQVAMLRQGSITLTSRLLKLFPNRAGLS